MARARASRATLDSIRERFGVLNLDDRKTRIGQFPHGQFPVLLAVCGPHDDVDERAGRAGQQIHAGIRSHLNQSDPR